MAGRWANFGQYHAQGVSGADALAYGIERMVTGIASPVDSERGLSARLRYLTASDAGYAAMEAVGLTPTTNTLLAWLEEERTPNRANLQRIDDAYWELRRHNLAPDLKRRLNSGGGTRIEIDPVDQTQVAPEHRRDISTRSLMIRNIWDDAVDAWLDEDEDTLDAIWDDIIEDIGSEYDSYSYVSSVGWSA